MTTTQEQLLDAVDRVITEHGPSGVTLRRVGAEAGLSHTAAAHYFGDKPGLFTAYITRAWHQVADLVIAAIGESDDRSAMLATAQSYAEFALAEPAAFSVMNRLEFTRVDAPELWEARERGYFALASLIERCQNNGWAADRELLDVLSTVWGFVHGFVDLWVGGVIAAPYDGQDFVETLCKLLDTVLDGLAD